MWVLFCTLFINGISSSWILRVCQRVFFSSCHHSVHRSQPHLHTSFILHIYTKHDIFTFAELIPARGGKKKPKTQQVDLTRSRKKSPRLRRVWFKIQSQSCRLSLRSPEHSSDSAQTVHTLKTKSTPQITAEYYKHNYGRSTYLIGISRE